jgi:hypothetical protein
MAETTTVADEVRSQGADVLHSPASRQRAPANVRNIRRPRVLVFASEPRAACALVITQGDNDEK